jgi:hypothetical protein
MNKTALRSDDKTMDARPSPDTNSPCGLLVLGLRHGLWSRRKPQTRFVVTTGRAVAPQTAGGCRNPLLVMNTMVQPVSVPVACGTLAQGCLIHG